MCPLLTATPSPACTEKCTGTYTVKDSGEWNVSIEVSNSLTEYQRDPEQAMKQQRNTQRKSTTPDKL